VVIAVFSPHGFTSSFAISTATIAVSAPCVMHFNRRENMKWRVVYGETVRAWEMLFPTRAKARAFAKEHRSFGDIIFSIKQVVPGEPPQSMAEAIRQEIEKGKADGKVQQQGMPVQS
jgi:hypothetical protein